MQKILINIPLLIFGVLLLGSTSCTKEEKEPRTREIEMAELDSLIRMLENDGEDIDTTDLSVFYIIRKEGEGPFPKTGDSCSVSYIGFLPNGAKFEDSRDIYPGKVWNFNYMLKKEVHEVIGLIDGIGHVNEGGEIEMYVPSDLAYGSRGTANVPPYTTLVYRATLNELKPKL